MQGKRRADCAGWIWRRAWRCGDKAIAGNDAFEALVSSPLKDSDDIVETTSSLQRCISLLHPRHRAIVISSVLFHALSRSRSLSLGLSPSRAGSLSLSLSLSLASLWLARSLVPPNVHPSARRPPFPMSLSLPTPIVMILTSGDSACKLARLAMSSSTTSRLSYLHATKSGGHPYCKKNPRETD